jgi:hypothetical protein
MPSNMQSTKSFFSFFKFTVNEGAEKAQNVTQNNHGIFGFSSLFFSPL